MSGNRACYFYPFTTTCPTRSRRAVEVTSRPLISEHDLVRAARPAWRKHDSELEWAGAHAQPKRYVLDQENNFTTDAGWDDADPAAMTAHLRLMHTVGLNTVIFNAYGGLKSGSVRESGFEMLEPINTFLKVNQDVGDFRFATNFCLSSPRVVFPVPVDLEKSVKAEIRKDYELSIESIEVMFEMVASRFMTDSRYLRHDGKPVLIMYDAVKITRLVPHFDAGTLAETLRRLRAHALEILGTDLHIVGLVFKPDDAEVAEAAGFDAISSYILLPQFDRGQEEPIQSYPVLLEETLGIWEKMVARIRIPFYPSVVPGWDAWPRCEQGRHILSTRGSYPYSPIVVHGTPELYGSMLRSSINFIQKRAEHIGSKPLFHSLLACWNEMSEGCSILPTIDSQGALDRSYMNVTARYLLEDNHGN